MKTKPVPSPPQDFSVRLLECLEERKQERHGAGKWLADTFGVTSVTGNDWLNGRFKPDEDKVDRMARLFKVNFEWLFRGNGPKRGDAQPMDEPLIKVPLISFTRAGSWSDVADSYEPGDGEYMVHTTARVGKRAFALRVRGDSMVPKIPDGAILIVDPDGEALPGRVVVVRQNHDSEATVKTLVRDGNLLFLKPENDRYPVMMMREDAVICGVVRQVIQDLF